MKLITIKDVIDLKYQELGYERKPSRQWMHCLLERDGAPEPVASPGGKRVWNLEDIKSWDIKSALKRQSSATNQSNT